MQFDVGVATMPGSSKADTDAAPIESWQRLVGRMDAIFYPSVHVQPRGYYCRFV